MARKRTLETFFSPLPATKKARSDHDDVSNHASNHPTYPFPIPNLPPSIGDRLTAAPAAAGRAITNRPDLDLLYFKPYIPRGVERDLFEFLRRELFFYRVQYSIKRGPEQTSVTTPR